MPINVVFNGENIPFPDGTPDSTIQAELSKRAAQGAQDNAAGLASGLARSAGQGLTFGFGDEITAGVRSLMGEKYDAALADERQKLHAFQREHPVASMGAELVGGAPLMLIPGMGVAKGAGMAGNMLRMAGTGAVYGALNGLGTGEGIEDRLARAKRGTIAGGLLGGAMPPVAAGAGKVAQLAADYGSVIPGVRWATSRLPGATAPGAERGGQKALEAIQRDGLTLDDVEQRLQAGAQMGKPMAVADVGGANTHGLADAAMLTPSAARGAAADALQERAANQPERIWTDLRQHSGVNQSDAYALAQQIAERRQAAAAPLYAQAYSAGDAPIVDPELLKILGMPHIGDAFKSAQRIATLEGTALPQIATADGRISQPPNLQTWDYIKRGLDDLLYQGKRQGSLGRTEMRALGDVRKQMVDRLDTMFPDYAKARSVYAGDTRLLDAMEQGADFDTLDPRAIKDLLDTEFTNPSERQHFLLGAIDGLKQKISQAPDGADIYKRVFGSDWKRQQLRELFPSQDAFDKFQQAMSAEKAMRITQDAVNGNSKTALRASNLADISTGTTSHLDPVHMLWGNFEQAVRRKVQAANSQAIVPLLLDTKDPQAQLQALRGIADRVTRRGARPYRSAPITGLLAGQYPD
jgi:hypothetical protein